MADAKDILGLTKIFPANGAVPLERRPKAPKDASHRKPDGVSREVYALTGGLPPIMPAPDPAVLLRKRPASSKKVQWRWLPFKSSSRGDGLELHHWVQLADGKPPAGDYSFAKFNKAVDIVQYTREEYAAYLRDPRWTEEETAHLFELCRRFDLRFAVIADRFDGGGGSEGAAAAARSVEELKERYHAVARSLLLARIARGEDARDHPLLKEPYNMKHEVERKHALHLLLSQTRQQELEEKDILAEAQRILAARQEQGGVGDAPAVAALAAGLAASGSRGGAASSSGMEAPSASGRLPPTPSTASARMARMYMRGVRLGQAVTAAANSAGARMARRIDHTLEELGVPVKPLMPTREVCTEHLKLRRDVSDLLNLQKRVQWKEKEVEMLRTNPHAEGLVSLTAFGVKRASRGSAATRGGAPPGDLEAATPGERLGARELKDKGQTRAVEITGPQQKRARKLKVLED